MKLLENIKGKITKDENGETFSRLEKTGVVLVNSNIVKND